MKVRELIAELSHYPDDAEVMLATQPHYPLQFEVASVAGVRIKDPLANPSNAEVVDVVYIGQGADPWFQPYLDGTAARALEWSR